VTIDVAVVGAGPAGLAAATRCARLGLATTLFDEQPAPGGQIWRGVTAIPPDRARLFGPEYARGEGEVDALRASNASPSPLSDAKVQRRMSIENGRRMSCRTSSSSSSAPMRASEQFIALQTLAPRRSTAPSTCAAARRTAAASQFVSSTSCFTYARTD